MWQDCVSGSSLVVSFENARTSFRRSSSFLFFWDVSARTFHFVATRIIFFLSQEIKKHLLGRGSLIYHLVQPVTEVRPQTKGTIFNFVSSLKLSLEAPTLKKKKKRQGRRRNVEQCLPFPPPETLFYYHVR